MEKEERNIDIMLEDSREKYYKFLLEQYKKGILAPDKIELLKIERLIPRDPNEIYFAPNVKLTQRGIRVDLDPYNDPRLDSLTNIVQNDWMPKSVLVHTDEFFHFINSILYGHIDKIFDYKPFLLYRAQAYNWLKDTDNISDYHTSEGRREYMFREYNRIKENTLYFADRYGELKEGDCETGVVKYTAKMHHAVIFFIADCGYSVIDGKGRQIGLTSALGVFAVKKLLMQVNYYIKFITEDTATGIEIFNDKIKYLFGELPGWLQPPVKSDSGQRFWLSDKRKKGDKGSPNSRVDVVAPKLSAINGGSPQLVLLDEIGYIDILGGMLNEGRPTMFMIDAQGNFTMRRQIIGWGTGGFVSQAYRNEWYRILGLWESRNVQSGFVPLFFSWKCRMTEAEYELEKAWYYGARAAEMDIDIETSKVQFHQHYPSTFRDMFMTKSNTLVSRTIIEEGLQRCIENSSKVVYGYFEPIYDEAIPTNNLDTPFKILGSNFIVVSDEDIGRASAIMYKKPEKFWKNRYWQGTDPIAAETGISKMASAIWDEYEKTISCLLNFRKQWDHKYVFLQSMLMGIYYDTSEIKLGVKELLEANIGTNYTDYKELHGFFDSLIFNSQLPSKVMGGSREIGIDNKGLRTDAIIDYMTEIFKNYSKNIFIKVVFDQLGTFIYDISKTGKEVWGSHTKYRTFNDALYAVVYAYIARMAYPHLYPSRLEGTVTEYKIRYELQRTREGKLIRQPVRRPVIKPMIYG